MRPAVHLYDARWQLQFPKKDQDEPIDHLYRWEEMMRVAGLLPTGDIEMPNVQLLVEWFYMTFHKSDHAEYVQSRCKLHD